MIYGLGPSALLAKRDLKSAYRIIPIREQDFCLLGIKVDGKYYVDKFLPMGLSHSAAIFEKFSIFLQWVVIQQARHNSMAHLLDDFLFAGPRGTSVCFQLVSAFEFVCRKIGVPIAHDKSVEPTTIMVFLGLELDTNEMSVRVPVHKVMELQTLIQTFLGRKKVPS